jgi:putative exporter of polyketide antibiotics
LEDSRGSRNQSKCLALHISSLPKTDRNTNLGLCLLIELGGELQLLSQPALDLSPFTHVPKVLVGEGSGVSLIWLALVAAALAIAGLAGFRHRDLD